MRDGPLRSLLKRLTLSVRRFDLTVMRRSHSKAPYVLGGACRRSGSCCEAPALGAGWSTMAIPLLRRAFLAWQRHVNGFELVETLDTERTFIFRCHHFDRETRTCDSYATRPSVCRDYPVNLLDQPNPVFLPGCGHRPILHNAAAFRLALAEQDLSPEQRSALHRNLHLD